MKIDYSNEIWRDVPGYEGLYMVSNLGRVKSLNYNRTGKERIMKCSKDENGYPFVQLWRNGVAKIFKVHRLVAMAFLEPVEGKDCVDHINGVRDANWVELKEDENGNLVVASSNLRWCTHKENCNFELALKNRSVAQKIAQNRPEVKERARVTQKIVQNRPEVNAKRSASIKAANAIPESNAKRKAATKEVNNRPEVKEKLSKATKARWDNQEYREKLSKAMKGKRLNRQDLSKIVLQYTLEGEFVAEYPSSNEAARQTGYNYQNICGCCNGKRKQAYGFIWRYKQKEEAA